MLYLVFFRLLFFCLFRDVFIFLAIDIHDNQRLSFLNYRFLTFFLSFGEWAPFD